MQQSRPEPVHALPVLLGSSFSKHASASPECAPLIGISGDPGGIPGASDRKAKEKEFSWPSPAASKPLQVDPAPAPSNLVDEDPPAEGEPELPGLLPPGPPPGLEAPAPSSEERPPATASEQRAAEHEPLPAPRRVSLANALAEASAEGSAAPVPVSLLQALEGDEELSAEQQVAQAATATWSQPSCSSPWPTLEPWAWCQPAVPGWPWDFSVPGQMPLSPVTAETLPDLAPQLGSPMPEQGGLAAEPGSKPHRSGATQQRGARRRRLWAHFYLHMQAPGFDLVPRMIGRGGCKMRQIADSTGAKIRIRGCGSGYYEVGGRSEAPTPLMVAVTTDYDDPQGFKAAVELTLRELRVVEGRFWAYCHHHNHKHCGPCYSVGRLSENAREILGDAVEGVP